MYGGGRLPGDDPVIWRATAAGPDGPWALHPVPVLEPSTVGWDDDIVDHPSVVAAGYRLHFEAMRSEPRDVMVIGQLSIEDGITWRCAVDGPLVEPDDVVEGASLHSYLVVRGGEHDELLVEVLGPDTPSSDIWLVAP